LAIFLPHLIVKWTYLLSPEPSIFRENARIDLLWNQVATGPS
jgi:hypothetical protein